MKPLVKRWLNWGCRVMNNAVTKTYYLRYGLKLPVLTSTPALRLAGWVVVPIQDGASPIDGCVVELQTWDTCVEEIWLMVPQTWADFPLPAGRYDFTALEAHPEIQAAVRLIHDRYESGALEA